MKPRVKNAILIKWVFYPKLSDRLCKDIFTSLSIYLFNKYVNISYVPSTIPGTGIDQWLKQNTYSVKEDRQQTKQVNEEYSRFGKCNKAK